MDVRALAEEEVQKPQVILVELVEVEMEEEEVQIVENVVENEKKVLDDGRFQLAEKSVVSCQKGLAWRSRPEC